MMSVIKSLVGSTIDYLTPTSTFSWDNNICVPPQRLITDRKQPHRKTGIAKARREAKKRRNRKLNG